MGTREGGKPLGRHGPKTTNLPRKLPTGTGARYVVTVLGEIPVDARERVSSVHACAIRANRLPDFPAPAPRRSRDGR